MIHRDKLIQLLGDAQLADKYIELARKELPAQLEKLEQAITDHDWPAAAVVAHGLKSQVDYLGLDACAAQAQEIEQICELQTGTEKCQDIFEKLNQEILKALSR